MVVGIGVGGRFYPMNDCVLFFQGSFSSGWSNQGQSGLIRKPLSKENGREASAVARSTHKARGAPQQPSRGVTENSGRIYDRKYLFQCLCYRYNFFCIIHVKQ